MGEGSDSEILRRDVATHDAHIENLRENNRDIWASLNGLRDAFSAHRSQTALIQGAAVIVNALVIYLITKGSQ